jgi:hypothetical protein
VHDAAPLKDGLLIILRGRNVWAEAIAARGPRFRMLQRNLPIGADAPDSADIRF